MELEAIDFEPMRKLIVAITLFLSVNVLAQVWVNGYYRKDGTYVQGYYSSSPNSTPYDNWSTQGNVNPYTGQPGTINPNGSTNNNGVMGNYSIGSGSIYAPPAATPPTQYYYNSSGTSLLNWMLTSRRSSSFLLGKNEAKNTYKVKKYIFWSSFGSTAIFMPVGAAVFIGENFIRKKIDTGGTGDYSQGYRKKARRKIFWKSFGGFTLGLITNIAIGFVIERKIYVYVGQKQ